MKKLKEMKEMKEMQRKPYLSIHPRRSRTASSPSACELNTTGVLGVTRVSFLAAARILRRLLLRM